MKSKIIFCLALILSGSSIVAFADETNATSSKPEVEMYLGVNGKTNNNTSTLDATNSLKEFVNTVATNYEKFILSSTNAMGTNFAPVLPIMATYMKSNFLSIMTNSSVLEMGAAEKFLIELKKQNRLPGTPKESHGSVSTIVGDISKFKEAKYPFAMTFHSVLIGDSLTNHYTVMRPSADADWQLQKAWRTDTEGNTILEWPIK
jgi:hypothetical protein